MIQNLRTLNATIENSGGKLYLVGGYVRDFCLNIPSIDFDCEIFGLQIQDVQQILENCFSEVKLAGNNFPVFRAKNSNKLYDYQFSLPRTEQKNGVGYNGFVVSVDPFMSLVEASLRRDFTINSMYMNLAGEIFDPHNGIADLKNKVIKPVSSHFVESPERILRAFYQASRFGFQIDPKIVEYGKILKSEYGSLSHELINELWVKWAKNATIPSIGLQFLKDCEWLQFIPILDQLENIPQDKKYHPEGNVWIHTKQVCDYSAQHFHNDYQLLFACLLHDIGKVNKTFVHENGKVSSIGHEFESYILYQSEFFNKLNPMWYKKDLEVVGELVRYHMFGINPPSTKSILKQMDQLKYIVLDDLLKIIQCDRFSRMDSHGNRPSSFSHDRTRIDDITRMYNKIGTGKFVPIVKGQDFIDLGIPSGPIIGKMFAYAKELQIDGGVNKEEIIERTLQYFGE